MSFSRRLYDASGGFREDLGLAGKGIPQLVHDERLFTRAADCLGEPGVVYDPEMEVTHIIPEKRLGLEYLEQRFYGEGVSDAQMIRIEAGENSESAVADLLHKRAMHLPGIRHHVDDQSRALCDEDRATFCLYYLRCHLMALSGVLDAHLARFEPGRIRADYRAKEVTACRHGRKTADRSLNASTDPLHAARAFSSSVLKSRPLARERSLIAQLSIRLAYWDGLWQGLLAQKL